MVTLFVGAQVGGWMCAEEADGKVEGDCAEETKEEEEEVLQEEWVGAEGLKGGERLVWVGFFNAGPG